MRNLIGQSVTITDQSKTAIQLLAEQDWDILFLDHDLGGRIFVESGENTGYEVAKWLEEHPERQPKQILLHSLNPDGRKNMKAALPAAQEVPFAWALIKIDYADTGETLQVSQVPEI